VEEYVAAIGGENGRFPVFQAADTPLQLAIDGVDAVEAIIAFMSVGINELTSPHIQL